MQRAAKVATIADHSPSGLKRIAMTSLLAARGVTEDVRAQYKGEKGTSAQRATLDNRLKTLDTELKRRGIDDPASAVDKQWPEWKRMEKITFGKGTKGKTGKEGALETMAQARDIKVERKGKEAVLTIPFYDYKGGKLTRFERKLKVANNDAAIRNVLEQHEEV